jgi:hypothetical protein
MTTEQMLPDEAQELAEIAIVARRAGLRLSATELASIVEPYRRVRAGLEALRLDLESTEEPAATFDPLGS